MARSLLVPPPWRPLGQSPCTGECDVLARPGHGFLSRRVFFPAGALELLTEPGAGERPQPFGGPRGDAEDFRRIGDGQAAEVAELDQVGRGTVRGREFRQRLVQGQYVFARL